MDATPSNDIPAGTSANPETAVLRGKLDELAVDQVHPAVVAVADNAQKAVDWVEAETGRWASKIRERPLTSISLAALAGFVLAKLTRR